jgi:hypothetical protein
MTYLYTAYGLTLRLPFSCGALLRTDSPASPDIEVAEGPVPKSLPEAPLHDVNFDAEPDRFLFRGGRRSARFLVENGCRITVQRNDRCEADLFEHQLLFPIMAAVLRQRNLLVLHATAVAAGGTALVVTGETGAGKSTTLAGLVAKGWSMLSDDVTALRLDASGGLEVMPGVPRVSLHSNAANATRFDTTGLIERDWQRKKMSVPMDGVLLQRSQRLRCIAYLQLGRSQPVWIEKVSGRDKLPLLLRAVYGPLLPEQLSARFELFSTALENVDVLSITRPDGEWTLDAVIGALCDG